MIFRFLVTLTNNLFLWFEHQSTSKYWEFKLSLLCVLLCFIFSFPDYESNVDYLTLKKTKINATDTQPTAIAYARSLQIEHPFTPQPNYGAGRHQNKIAFRLTMPLIGHLFNLSLIHLIIIQNIIGFFLFYYTARFTKIITNDAVTSSLISVGLAFTYAGIASFVDLIPYFDGIGFFCLILAMYYRNSLIIGVLIFLACWIDERCLIATSFVFIWWKLNIHNFKKLTFTEVIKPDKYTSAIIAVWIIYFTIRYYLSYKFNLSVESIGFEALRSNWPHYFFGILTGIEFYWIILFFTILLLYIHKNYWILTLYLFSLLIMIFVSVSVLDITRSIAYNIPLIIIGFAYIGRTDNKKFIRYTAASIMAFNFLLPTYFIIGNQFFIVYSPIIPKVLKYVF